MHPKLTKEYTENIYTKTLATIRYKTYKQVQLKAKAKCEYQHKSLNEKDKEQIMKAIEEQTGQITSDVMELYAVHKEHEHYEVTLTKAHNKYIFDKQWNTDL